MNNMQICFPNTERELYSIKISDPTDLSGHVYNTETFVKYKQNLMHSFQDDSPE